MIKCTVKRVHDQPPLHSFCFFVFIYLLILLFKVSMLSKTSCTMTTQCDASSFYPFEGLTDLKIEWHMVVKLSISLHYQISFYWINSSKYHC